jgi:hypothetical protein
MALSSSKRKGPRPPQPRPTRRPQPRPTRLPRVNHRIKWLAPPRTRFFMPLKLKGDRK